jgi:hypothetical protein
MDLHVKCENGFVATIRRDTRNSELRQLHEHNGLSKPHHLRGNLYLWWNLCVRLVYLGIAKEN